MSKKYGLELNTKKTSSMTVHDEENILIGDGGYKDQEQDREYNSVLVPRTLNYT